MEAHLARAIETAKAGHKDQARDLLIFILREDPRNVTAWKWFATVAKSEEEARQALNNILILDPDDAWAREGLGKLGARQRRREAAPQPAEKEITVRPATMALIGVALLAACGIVLAAAALASGAGGDIFGLAAQAPTSAPLPLVGGDAAFSPPTLPPTWTPSSIPVLPTVTPAATLTPTLTPPASVTPVPTPAMLDMPVESDVEQVPLDTAPDTSSPVVESQTVRYYAVTGSNAQAINQSIVDNGPKGGGQDAIAQVQYNTALHYTMRQTSSSCAPEVAVAYLTLEFTYPQYHPPPDASQELVDQWNAFMERVVAHEEHHAQIARECALDMVNSYYSLPPASTCPALQNNLAAMQESKDAACDARQLAFDEAEGGDSFP